MHHDRLAGVAIAALVLLVFGGCAATASPRWDAEFGDHARGLNAQQLVDAGAAARNGQTNARVDARSVRDAMVQHGDTFRAPPQPSVISIGVGSGR